MLLLLNKRRLQQAFINKRYHKLGNYLHTPTVGNENKIVDKQKLHNYLIDLACELSVYVEATSYSTVVKTLCINCFECNTDIIRNSKSLNVGSIVKCFKPNCEAEYLIKEIARDNCKYEPFHAKLTCQCQNVITIPTHKIKENEYVSCKNCDNKHVFQKRWCAKTIE